MTCRAVRPPGRCGLEAVIVEMEGRLRALRWLDESAVSACRSRKASSAAIYTMVPAQLTVRGNCGQCRHQRQNVQESMRPEQAR